MESTKKCAEREIYLQQYNKRFAVLPLSKEIFFKSLSIETDLSEVFCDRYTRRVLNGHRFSFNNQLLIIETKELQYSLVGRDVEVRVYRDKTIRFICNGIELKVLNYQKKNNLPWKFYAKLNDKVAA